MPSRLITHWRGLLLSLVGIAATVWLATTGRLGLYIHPRYFVFTVVMALIAGVVAILAFALVPGTPSDDDAHDHGESPVSPARARWATVGTILLVATTAAAMLVIPPTTLTTQTVQNRAINASAAGDDDTPELAGADTSAFTVRDWAVLLRQGADAESLASAEPELLGFVTPDPDSPDVFYVARFTVTCCAVDAQPLGVPVYLPGWQDEYPIDSWVEATGHFAEPPAGSSNQPVVLIPETVTPATQPTDPYVY